MISLCPIIILSPCFSFHSVDISAVVVSMLPPVTGKIKEQRNVQKDTIITIKSRILVFSYICPPILVLEVRYFS
jgi:hypothetical protein